MARTSTQKAGTATTRSAKPKPIGASSASRSDQRGISSRTRSWPVTPRCSRPAASSRGISAAESSTSSMPSTPWTVPRYSRSAALRASVMPRAANQAMVSCCSRPLDGTPSFSRIAPPAPRGGPCRRRRGSPAPAPARGSARRSARRWRSAAGPGGRGAARRRRSRRSIPAWCGRSSPRSAAPPGRSRATPARRGARRSGRRRRASPGRPRARTRSFASAASALPVTARTASRRATSDAASGGVAASAARRATRAATSPGVRRPMAAPAAVTMRGVAPSASAASSSARAAVAAAWPSPKSWRSAWNRPGRQTWRRSAALRRVAGVERVDRRQHQAEVAGDEVDRGVAERRDDQRQHLGVVRRRVAGLEDLEAGLQVLPRPVGAEVLPPPDRAAVDVARGLGAGVHVQADDRDGEVRAEHHLGALVAGDEGAGADVLAVEVEEHVGGLQRRGLDAHGAGASRGRRGCAPPRRRAARGRRRCARP